MLFGVIHPEALTLFSGPNRSLNAEVLLHLYEECYRSEFRFPTQTDVVAVIYVALGQHGHLWREETDAQPLDDVSAPKGRRLKRRQRANVSSEATGEAMSRARYIYGRFVMTGWLTETRFGLRTTVAMPGGALRLAELFCNLREGLAEPLGGLVVEVRNALNAVRTNAGENALGLNKAARDATAFGRYLRSVLAALNDVDRQVVGSATVGERLQHYFDDFIERVLLRDYAVITTTSHPYRFRRRILETVQLVEESPMDLRAIAEAYLQARLVKDADAARDLVQDDLETIRRVFDSIEEAFRRIQQHRARLEMRLRNTVRYAGRRVGAFLSRSETLIRRLDQALAAPDQLARPVKIPGLLWPLHSPWAPEVLARPRGPRAPIPEAAITVLEDTPLAQMRRALERDYLNRLNVRPRQVLRFLEQRIPPFGRREAAYLRIEGVDDFLAFEALRTVASLAIAGILDEPFVRRVTKHFSFEISAEPRMENDWLVCSGFVIARLSEHVTLESDLAA